MRLRPSILAAAAAAFGLIVGGTVVAVAVDPTPNPVNACVSKSTGAVRVVASTGQCKSSETKLVWNQSGPSGAPGEPGADGVSGYEVITTEQHETALSFFGGAAARCPEGKHVTGGGAIATTDTGGSGLGGVQDGYKVLNSSPFSDVVDGQNIGWRATFDINNPLNDPFVLRVYAICATVTP
jgi:hypothetical protein